MIDAKYSVRGIMEAWAEKGKPALRKPQSDLDIGSSI